MSFYPLSRLILFNYERKSVTSRESENRKLKGEQKKICLGPHAHGLILDCRLPAFRVSSFWTPTAFSKRNRDSLSPDIKLFDGSRRYDCCDSVINTD